MNKPLVIVESPTKVRTIKKVLGGKYNVAATVGHIRDLPPREIGIDIDNDFKPRYQTISGKQKVITDLKKKAGDTEVIYLAPDPDREGEAIAWHTAHVLKKKNRRFHRVLFHELTKNAIHAAITNPLELDPAKYDAQQARRILDRLVGYQISPLLWKKVKQGLSAGRVQSVAVRIICDRERAIFAFETEEYWSITADLAGPDGPDPDRETPVFSAKLVKKGGQKLKIPDGKIADEIVKALKASDFIVDNVKEKTIRKNPRPPFITSNLQQEAIGKLRFTARKTMQIAQQLYEGIELGPGEPVGLITYMRTDSVRISQEAAGEARDLIFDQFGPKYGLPKPRFFKNKNKAQDAHEAIRPTSVHNTPERITPYLNKDQAALYRLIWNRFVASQMAQALIDRNTITIRAGAYILTATGSRIRFPGFMSLYTSAKEQAGQKKQKAEENKNLPHLEAGMALTLKKLNPKQHFTSPPPRFSEASLIKELEENGIGRPSTYAAILSTIRDKGYVELIRRYFRPTELGFIVNDLIVANFPDLMNVDFTATLETDLDRIESADLKASVLLNRFYDSFKKRLETADENMISMKRTGVSTGITCPKCEQHRLHVKMGKNGLFLACDGYPDCSYTRNYERDEKGIILPVEPKPDQATGKLCPNCGKSLVKKEGKFGEFIACTGYPDCRYTEPVNQAKGSNQKTGVPCPKKSCGGEMTSRTSKRGKIFYSCSNYPKCKFAIWDKPVQTPCPNCNASFLVEKSTKKDGDFLACLTKECGYRR